jgi:hypothetical protein
MRRAIGPEGWKYKDWAGVVCPTPSPRGFVALAHIADYFTTVGMIVLLRPSGRKRPENGSQR